MSPQRQPRLELRPLLDRAHCDGDLAALSRMLTANERSISRWAAHGIPITAADRAAIDLGLHPMNIWGDEWLHAGTRV